TRTAMSQPGAALRWFCPSGRESRPGSALRLGPVRCRVQAVEQDVSVGRADVIGGAELRAYPVVCPGAHPDDAEAHHAGGDRPEHTGLLPGGQQRHELLLEQVPLAMHLGEQVLGEVAALLEEDAQLLTL